MAIPRYTVVLATFEPVRRDDLKPEAREWIGVRMRWMAGWEVEPADGGPYVGQMAMLPYEATPEGLKRIGWVPECDLRDFAEADAPGEAAMVAARSS